jgi:hypothetical protein
MPLIKTNIDSIKYSRYIIHINTAHGGGYSPLSPPLATPLHCIIFNNLLLLIQHTYISRGQLDTQLSFTTEIG